jgi:hypothetical protein
MCWTAASGSTGAPPPVPPELLDEPALVEPLLEDVLLEADALLEGGTTHLPCTQTAPS